MLEITEEYMDSMYENERGYDPLFDERDYEIAEEKALQKEIESLAREGE